MADASSFISFLRVNDFSQIYILINADVEFRTETVKQKRAGNEKMFTQIVRGNGDGNVFIDKFNRVFKERISAVCGNDGVFVVIRQVESDKFHEVFNHREHFFLREAVVILSDIGKMLIDYAVAEDMVMAIKVKKQPRNMRRKYILVKIDDKSAVRVRIVVDKHVVLPRRNNPKIVGTKS